MSLRRFFWIVIVIVLLSLALGETGPFDSIDAEENDPRILSVNPPD